MSNITDLQGHALDLTQALLGSISSNFRAVSIELPGPAVVVTIVLESHDDEDLEEIEDVQTLLEAMSGRRDLKFDVHISNEKLICLPPTESKMLVYRRREE
jgi:hypothetical protein